MLRDVAEQLFHSCLMPLQQFRDDMDASAFAKSCACRLQKEFGDSVVGIVGWIAK